MGYGRVQLDGKYGFVDATGAVTIEPIYDETDDFQDSQADLIAPNFGLTGDDEDILAIVLVGTHYGAIDKTGKFVIEPIYTNDFGFDCGYARVYIDDKCGYIDATGAVVIPIEFDFAYQQGDFFVARRDDTAYAFDETGQVIFSITGDDLDIDDVSSDVIEVYDAERHEHDFLFPNGRRIRGCRRNRLVV